MQPGLSRQDERRLANLSARYRTVRSSTVKLCAPLEVEDYVVQSMEDASPARWHLAHTTWFFETFVLKAASPQYRPFHAAFEHLFNSYYNAVGPQMPRAERGTLSRPTVAEVQAYRRHVDEHMETLLEETPEVMAPFLEAIELGINHEQQHQELILTDLKHALSRNPLRPVYGDFDKPEGKPTEMSFLEHDGGVSWIGHDEPGFAFDNESPRHRRFVARFGLGDRLVTNAEYLAFMNDGGYEQPELWLSEGWENVRNEGWCSPLYWERRGDDWLVFTLCGMQRVDPAQPVCHVSYFEADAFSRWSGARLPTEAEWEVAAPSGAPTGNFVEDGYLAPKPASTEPGLKQMFGSTWEWTSDPYVAYPGYEPSEGALGEYNGKFMVNQMVLRGGSCVTPRTHIRRSYRNFFPPHVRWQFSGIRLARDA